jgi:hypothetical protein
MAGGSFSIGESRNSELESSWYAEEIGLKRRNHPLGNRSVSTKGIVKVVVISRG